MVQWGVFKTLHEAFCVCAVGYQFMQFCAVSPRSAVSDKHVVTICGIGRQREVKIAPTVVCVLSVAVPEDFFRFAARSFLHLSNLCMNR